uniref:RNA-binding protein 5-A n=1 Tax=Lygus hesperus TaxID=30085 RepID=A0A0A9YHS2_LYGHE
MHQYPSTDTGFTGVGTAKVAHRSHITQCNIATSSTVVAASPQLHPTRPRCVGTVSVGGSAPPAVLPATEVGAVGLPVQLTIRLPAQLLMHAHKCHSNLCQHR